MFLIKALINALYVCVQPTWDASHIQGVSSESHQRGGRPDLVVVHSIHMQLHHIIPFDH